MLAVFIVGDVAGLWGRQRWLSGNDWADARVPIELPKTDSSLSLSHGECRQTCRGNRSSVMLKSKPLALGLAYSWGGGYGQQVCTSRICVPATANQKSTSPFCPAEGARLRVQHERILRLAYSVLHSSSQGRLVSTRKSAACQFNSIRAAQDILLSPNEVMVLADANSGEVG